MLHWTSGFGATFTPRRRRSVRYDEHRRREQEVVLSRRRRRRRPRPGAVGAPWPAPLRAAAVRPDRRHPRCGRLHSARNFNDVVRARAVASAVRNLRHVVRAIYQTLGQTEAECELEVVAGRTHGHRHRLSVDPQFHRLLAGQEVGASATCAAFDPDDKAGGRAAPSARYPAAGGERVGNRVGVIGASQAPSFPSSDPAGWAKRKFRPRRS